jgi:hypothetical protein
LKIDLLVRAIQRDFATTLYRRGEDLVSPLPLPSDVIDQLRDQKKEVLDYLDRHPAIVAIGDINLGWEQYVSESSAAANIEPIRDNWVRPGGARNRSGIGNVVDSATGGLGKLRITRSLSRLKPDSPVLVSDKGLLSSYGIFGAPGSGKTHLLEHLLSQIFSYRSSEPSLKVGALILDPKAALIENVRELVANAGRSEDLVILNVADMNRTGTAINVLDCGLSMQELGKFLVLAGRSAGSEVNEPFWYTLWGELFVGALTLIRYDCQAISVKSLLRAIDRGSKGRAPIEETADRVFLRVSKKNGREVTSAELDAALAIKYIRKFFQNDKKNISVVESLISGSFGSFEWSKYECFSATKGCMSQLNSVRRYETLYDDIIQRGKIVLVSISPEDPTFSKVLCTLVKCLFQQTVRGRLGRYWSTLDGPIKYNFSRPIVLACDEFSQVASEIPGQPIGDGDFFSICRQNGCMGLVATQSVHMLETSSLKDSWRALFSNFAAKIFMRLVDNETIEEVTKLAGSAEWYVASQGTSLAGDGMSSSTGLSLQQRESLAVELLTGLQQGEGVVVGSLDGNKTSGMHFFRVPAVPGERLPLS